MCAWPTWWQKWQHYIDTVLRIGIVLMPIRIRMSILMPFRIRIGIKTVSILMRILPRVLHLLENQNFLLLVTALPVYNLSHQCQVLYLYNILKFCGKNLSTFSFAWNWYLFGSACPIPIRIQILQNDADPTRSGSGSTTLPRHYAKLVVRT